MLELSGYASSWLQIQISNWIFLKWCRLLFKCNYMDNENYVCVQFAYKEKRMWVLIYLHVQTNEHLYV